MDNTLYTLIYNYENNKYILKKQKRKMNKWYKVTGEYIVKNVHIE